MGEVLTLNTTGGRLWRTVREPIADALAGLDEGPHECRLGGGTTLAARWHHRDSFDVDLTVSRRANLGDLRVNFEQTMAALGGEAEYRPGRWTIRFEAGQVDLARLDPCPIPPDEIDRAFAENGLDEYFYQNVMGGGRIRRMAHAAVETGGAGRLLWETGQIPPPLTGANRSPGG